MSYIVIYWNSTFHSTPRARNEIVEKNHFPPWDSTRLNVFRKIYCWLWISAWALKVNIIIWSFKILMRENIILATQRRYLVRERERERKLGMQRNKFVHECVNRTWLCRMSGKSFKELFVVNKIFSSPLSYHQFWKIYFELVFASNSLMAA